jgi:hypothetical protein
VDEVVDPRVAKHLAGLSLGDASDTGGEDKQLGFDALIKGKGQGLVINLFVGALDQIKGSR